MNKRKFVVLAVLTIGLTPAVAVANSAFLVVTHLLTLAAVVVAGVALHIQMTKGII